MSSLADFETLRNLAARGKFLSLDHMREFTALNSDLADFLKLQARHDVYLREFDFDGTDTVEDSYWEFTEDSTATGFAIPATKTLGGSLQGATGTTDDGALSMIGPAIYKGDNYAGMHVHVKWSAVTSLQFEIGFIDAATDKTLPVITDVDTPASGNGGGDIAVVHLDTDQTLKTMAFVCDGTTSGMAATKKNIGVLLPTAATYMCFRIQLFDNHAQCIINNARDNWKVLQTNIEGGSFVRPWIFTRCRAGSASRTVDVDLAQIWGKR